MTRLFVIAVIFLSGCARYVQVPLPLPEKPDFPSYTNNEVRCLSDDVYYRVARRDLAYRFYVERLESVIRETWK